MFPVAHIIRCLGHGGEREAHFQIRVYEIEPCLFYFGTDLQRLLEQVIHT